VTIHGQRERTKYAARTVAQVEILAPYFTGTFAQDRVIGNSRRKRQLTRTVREKQAPAPTP